MSTPTMDINDLRTPYRAVALYLEDADSVEYVRKDVACVYDRVDGFLTLARDLRSGDLIGFRLKGFRNLFLTDLQRRYGLSEDDFVPLVSAIEQAVQKMGDALMSDALRRAAYWEAKKMAYEDNVTIRPLAA